MSNLEQKKREAYEKGVKIENLLVELLIRDGYSDSKGSNTDEDRNEHWDVGGTIDGVYTRIDVKGREKFDENNKTFLELQTVDGKIGWLYAVKMDTVAFERDDSFIFIKREELANFTNNKISFVDSIMGNRIYPNKSNIADYQRYNRKSRDDISVRAPLSDFKHLIYKIIYK